ncbi:MAG: 4'-phosphopantetheinyl transferase superfamily protein, partial [Gammaproteobacteria bacterium]|nr:4'-phosphopantetheinyl transferase superfamily protein [Gammaproteobacteria bacterium]
TDLIEGAFTPNERETIGTFSANEQEDVALRMWCAKEAAAKSLGMGLNGHPYLFNVIELRPSCDMAIVDVEGNRIDVSITRHNEKIIAVANF